MMATSIVLQNKPIDNNKAGHLWEYAAASREQLKLEGCGVTREKRFSLDSGNENNVPVACAVEIVYVSAFRQKKQKQKQKRTKR